MDAIGTARVPDHPTVQAALSLARRAPSVHNTQPWRLVFDGHRLQLYADTYRRLSSADPQGRQLIISCGALLDHIRTAFAAAGWWTEVIRLPDTARDHLAEIEFAPARDVSDTTRARAAAIDRRYTDRLPMLPPRDWEQVEPVLRTVAAAHEVSVDVLEGSARLRLAAASARSAALREYDPQYLNELHWWAGNDSPADGVPLSALVSAAELAQVGVGRAFPTAPPSLRRGELTDASQLLVIGSAADGPLQWLRSGEALSAVLLECTAAGLTTCPLTHITEIPVSRRAIANLVPGPAEPQVVVRVGTAPATAAQPPTPRRPVGDFLDLHRAA
ncbi:Acg family FMN-binding oxidoreductase [Nocardia sp. NPDC051750]|uniref:Acg family FMN-binding oxidoreductase n=1 Tax=Nocardia sp. NPDC051750 TaxID=3364325 RepID=UPI0037B87E2F